MNPPHGGRREGAGRPAEGAAPKVKTSISIDPNVLREITAEAERRGVSRSDLLEEGARLILRAAAPAQVTPIAGRATPNERWAGEPAEQVAETR